MLALVIASVAWLVVIWQLVHRHNARIEQSTFHPDLEHRLIAESIDPTMALFVTGLVPCGAFWVLWKMHRGYGLLMGVGLSLGIGVISNAIAYGFTLLTR